MDIKIVKERWLDFMLNIFGYKPKYIFARHLFIAVCAVIIINIASYISDRQVIANKNFVYGYLYAIGAFNFVSEMNLLIINYLSKNEFFKWKLYGQSIITFISSILMVLFTLFVGKHIFKDEQFLRDPMTQIVLLAGFLVILIHILFIQTVRVMNEWLEDKKEIDDLRQSKLISDYNSLKDRLNPHFLFNNLSVLKSLIHYNPPQAEVFTQNFTNVYRYVLDCYEKKTITVEQELRFLDSYIALHCERIGEHLMIDIDVNDQYLFKEIPPLSLQLLIENAIKHNVVNARNPLHISIRTNSNEIIVENNLKIKATTYSTNTGLSNLDQQYQLMTTKSIRVEKNETHFMVALPLI